MIRVLTLLAIAAAAPAAARAACAATDRALPVELGAWTAPRAIVTATPGLAADTPELAPRAAARVVLHPAAKLKLPVAPGQVKQAPDSHGGVLRLAVAEAGTYRVALSTGAWVDVLAGGRAVASTAHGHGPDCSTIRKIVDFPLAPGRYVIQLSGNPGPDVVAMVARGR